MCLLSPEHDQCSLCTPNLNLTHVEVQGHPGHFLDSGGVSGGTQGVLSILTPQGGIKTAGREEGKERSRKSTGS